MGVWRGECVGGVWMGECRGVWGSEGGCVGRRSVTAAVRIVRSVSLDA